MSPFRAFHWPGDGWHGQERDRALSNGAVFADPAVGVADLHALSSQLREAGGRLRERRETDDVVRSIDRVAARFLDPGDPIREAAEHHLLSVSGLSAEMIRIVLDRMPLDWREAPLRRLLHRNFPEVAVLSRFASTGGGSLVRAYPPRLTYHHLSGNVPGVGVMSIIRALLLRAPSLARTSAQEPVLPTLFARALLEEDELLGQAIAALHWPHHDLDLLRAAVQSADGVVVYGSDETVAAVSSHATQHARVAAYPHRVSLGYVTGEAVLAAETARAAAHAVAIFDQQGCVSPHLIFVEADGTEADRFADELGRALEALSRQLPRGLPNAAESALLREMRDTALFEELAGEPVRVITAGEPPDWLVILDRRVTFRPSCLHRVVSVVPVASVEEAAECVLPLTTALQTIGVAAPAHRLTAIADAFGSVGATRVTSLDNAAWPTAEWHHDGRPAMADLVRWCEIESG